MPNYARRRCRAHARELLAAADGRASSTASRSSTWRDPSPVARPTATRRASAADLPGGPWRVPKRIELVTLLDSPRSDRRRHRRVSQDTVATVLDDLRGASVRDGPTTQAYWMVDFGTAALVEPRSPATTPRGCAASGPMKQRQCSLSACGPRRARSSRCPSRPTRRRDPTQYDSFDCGTARSIKDHFTQLDVGPADGLSATDDVRAGD